MKNILKLISCNCMLYIFRRRLHNYRRDEMWYLNQGCYYNFYTETGIPKMKITIKALERLKEDVIQKKAEKEKKEIIKFVKYMIEELSIVFVIGIFTFLSCIAYAELFKININDPFKSILDIIVVSGIIGSQIRRLMK